MKLAWSIATVALMGLVANAYEEARDEKLDAAKFVKKAACGHMTEIKMGKIGQEKAENSQVKSFSERLVKDHTKLLEDLKAACREAKIECPTEQTREGKEECEKCEKLKEAKDFDVKFMKMQCEMHEKSLKVHQRAVKELDNAALKAYAEKAIPVIQEHLTLAKKIKKDLEASTSR